MEGKCFVMLDWNKNIAKNEMSKSESDRNRQKKIGESEREGSYKIEERDRERGRELGMMRFGR